MGLLDKVFGRRASARGPATRPNYANASVVDRIEREEGVDRATAKAWFDEMLIFLDLCSKSERVLAPPHDVDRAWHAFLLHSRDYESYCRERFGYVLHHDPAGEPDSEAYKRAYVARARWAGRQPGAAIWAVPVGFAAADLMHEDEAQSQAHAGGGGATGHHAGGSGNSDGGGWSGGIFGGDGGSGAGDGGGGASCGGGGGGG